MRGGITRLAMKGDLLFDGTSHNDVICVECSSDLVDAVYNVFQDSQSMTNSFLLTLQLIVKLLDALMRKLQGCTTASNNLLT